MKKKIQKKQATNLRLPFLLYAIAKKEAKKRGISFNKLQIDALHYYLRLYTCKIDI